MYDVPAVFVERQHVAFVVNARDTVGVLVS